MGGGLAVKWRGELLHPQTSGRIFYRRQRRKQRWKSDLENLLYLRLLLLVRVLGGASPRSPLVPLQHVEFALVRPGLCAKNIAVANRIIHDIMPFLRVGFRSAQLAIPKLTLPNRNLSTWWQPCRLRSPGSRKRHACHYSHARSIISISPWYCESFRGFHKGGPEAINCRSRLLSFFSSFDIRVSLAAP